MVKSNHILIKHYRILEIHLTNPLIYHERFLDFLRLAWYGDTSSRVPIRPVPIRPVPNSPRA